MQKSRKPFESFPRIPLVVFTVRRRPQNTLRPDSKQNEISRVEDPSMLHVMPTHQQFS